jgi:hypothetical protein
MKRPSEILDETFAEVGMCNFMNGIKTCVLKKWSLTAFERTIHHAMRIYAEQFQDEKPVTNQKSFPAFTYPKGE